MLLDTDTLTTMRANAALDHPDIVAHRAHLAAGIAAGHGARRNQQNRIDMQSRLIDAIALWAGHAAADGVTDDSERMRLFYQMYGVDVLTAISKPRVDMMRLYNRMSNTIQLDPLTEG